MKIVMLCRLYLPHIGGVEKHVRGISQEAIQEGHSVDVFTLKHDDKLPTEEIIDGVRVHRISERKLSVQPSSDYTRALRMSASIWERVQIWSNFIVHINTFLTADVIQIHDVFYWYWPLRLLMPWKKVFITYHGFEAGSLPTQKAKKTRQMIQRWTNGSMAVGAWIEKWYGTKLDVVTYGAADCTENSKTKIANTKKIRGVFIGRVAADTGAKVYKNVIDSLVNVKLDMYGEGSKLGTIENSCTVFPNYDIACVSSYLAIVEAMQSRTLVIAYAADELKYDYLISHPRAGDMIIVRSEAELHTVLADFSLASHQKKIDDAYDWARQQTWNRVYKKYLTLWGKL